MTWSVLHEACKHNETEAIIHLANRNDDAFETDDHGATPLHLLCLNIPDKLAVKVLVAANHMAVADRDQNGDTPVHLLCRHADIDPEIVEILLENDPHVLSVANNHGYLPLHVACKCASKNRDLLALLIKINPYAMLHHVKVGELQLKKRTSLEGTSDQITHHIIDPNAGLKTVDTIDLRMMENHEFDRDGSYPLHISIANGAPLDIVEMLTSSCNGKEVLGFTNKFGQTPLMVAILKHAGKDIVQFLLTSYPDALRIPDKKGNLPIHGAAEIGADPKTVDILLQHWPEAVTEANGEGLNAGELAIRFGKCSAEVTTLLTTV